MRILILIALLAFDTRDVHATCGDKGGPGYRSPNGKCVGWDQLGATCGSPPTTKCAAENTAAGAIEAAAMGKKVSEAGASARKAVGQPSTDATTKPGLR